MTTPPTPSMELSEHKKFAHGLSEVHEIEMEYKFIDFAFRFTKNERKNGKTKCYLNFTTNISNHSVRYVSIIANKFEPRASKAN